MLKLFARLLRQTPDALVAAALAGDVERVKSLLQAGVPVDSRDGKGGTALMAAAVRGKTELLVHLLAEGAQVDAVAPGGGTALGMAAYAGDPAVVEVLLDAGADANARSNVGTTPLMQAAKSGCLSAVRALLSSGADVAAAVRDSVRMDALPGDMLGFTALAFAVLFDHGEVVRTLRAHGARLDPTLPQGFTLLTLAAANGNESATRMLLTLGVDPNKPITSGAFAGSTAVSLAAARGHADLVTILTNHGAVDITEVRVKHGAKSSRRAG